MKTWKKLELCNHKIIKNIYCNKCGSKIYKNKFGIFADHLTIKKRWNYGSDFDNEIHLFDLCETCYKEFTKSFAIPVKKKNN